LYVVTKKNDCYDQQVIFYWNFNYHRIIISSGAKSPNIGLKYKSCTGQKHQNACNFLGHPITVSVFYLLCPVWLLVKYNWNKVEHIELYSETEYEILELSRN